MKTQVKKIIPTPVRAIEQTLVPLMRTALLITLVISFTSTAKSSGWEPASARCTPTRFVGKLIICYKINGKIDIRCGSGVLVGPRHVLTAGHCLIDVQKKWQGFPQSEWKPVAIGFIPSVQGNYHPYGGADCVDGVFSKKFGSGEDQTADWGGLVLNKRLGDKMGGWVGLEKWPNGKTQDVTVYGYSAMAFWPVKIKYSASNYQYVYWHKFFSDWSWGEPFGTGGVSGGPAINPSSGRVAGVYTGQAGGGFYGIIPHALVGTRLTDWTLAVLNDSFSMYP